MTVTAKPPFYWFAVRRKVRTKPPFCECVKRNTQPKTKPVISSHAHIAQQQTQQIKAKTQRAKTTAKYYF